jgi:hypothetical protein
MAPTEGGKKQAITDAAHHSIAACISTAVLARAACVVAWEFWNAPSGESARIGCARQ